MVDEKIAFLSHENGRGQRCSLLSGTCAVAIEKWQRRRSFSLVSRVLSMPKAVARVVWCLFVLVLCTQNRLTCNEPCKINTNVSKLYKTATYHLLTTVKPFSKALLMLRGGLYITWRSLTLLLCTGIPKIPYRPSAGPGEVMCFKHYHAEEVGVVHLLSCRYVTWNCCSEISAPVCRCWWGGRWRTGWGSRSATGTPSVELVLMFTGRVDFTFIHLIYMRLI